ncbi:MAG: tRNA 2-thiouridine(34) synthase MnmA [Lentisphaeria bacterium]|nr:tRNA 2-thiouridine(34) synthase MnmA [Lentisphaeria bacterium]
MKVVLAMSGGVDSGCAGAILRRSGHEVIGVTMLIDGFPPSPAMDAGVKECCSRLGIEHHYIDVSQQFKEKVIIPAAEEYASGRTPNPCSLCNPAIKFGELLKFTEAAGADRLATGHYVRTGCCSGMTSLLRGRDRSKDQSYFLALLDQKILEKLIFPLGELSKPVVRAVAADFGFAFHKAEDSEELCFVPPGVNSGDELLRRAGIPPRPGKIYFRGKVVGKHGGVHRVTLGQRQGLGVALGVPAFVCRIDGQRNRVELETDPNTLMSREFYLVRHYSGNLPEPGEYEIQIRYRSRPVPCAVSSCGPDLCKVETSVPLRAVTPGQIGALYRGEKLCGGGIINLTEELL